MMRTVSFIIALGLAMGLPVFGPATSAADVLDDFGIANPRVVKPAPPFALKDLEGRTVTLEQLRGKPILLNFWATWCGPCQEEMPAMQNLHRLMGNQMHIVAISIDRFNEAKIKRFVEEFGLTFSILRDPKQEVRNAYYITGLPTTYLIDAEGKLRGFASGARKWDSPKALEIMRLLIRIAPGAS